MDSLRKSLKSHGSYKNSSSRAASIDLDHQEDQPILLDHGHPSSDDADHRREVVVKIDGNSRQFEASNHAGVWRGSSYQFWREDAGTGRAGSGGSSDGGRGSTGFSFAPQQAAPPTPPRSPVTDIVEDPPTRLVSAFLQKEKARGGEVSLDVDIAELKKLAPEPISPAANSKELRVSFQEPSAESFHRRFGASSSSSSDSDDRSGLKDAKSPSVRNVSGGIAAGEGEVVRCSSNSSFRTTSSMLRTKTRSRLMDPPPLQSGEIHRRVPSSDWLLKSGQLRSGPLGPQQYDEDDDDPFVDEDVPEEYRRLRARFNPLIVLEWVSLVLIVAALVCSLIIPSLDHQTVWKLHLWKWEVMVLVLICGRLVSGCGIRIVVFFFERNFLLRKRVLYFVYGVRRAVQNCLWLGLVLIAWYCIFDKKVERMAKKGPLSYITKVLICLLVATVLRLVKTLLVKVLASSFHVSTYFDRIQESLFNQYVIETLSGPPVIEEEQLMAEVQKLRDAGATITPELRATALPSKSFRVIGTASKSPLPRTSAVGRSRRFTGAVSRRDFGWQQDDGITIDHLHRLNHKNISAWNMKRLMKIVRHGALSTLDEQIPDASREDESARQIRNEYEAKDAARKIFTNVAKPGSKYIYLVDLMRFMREDEALKTMSLFEGAKESKRVNRRSLKNWAVY